MKYFIIFALFFSPLAMANSFESSLVMWADSYGYHTPTPTKRKIVHAAVHYGRVHGVNPIMTLAVLSVESSYAIKAISPTGPKCLMQVATSWHQDKIGDRNIFDINTCIDVGTQIIKECARNHRGVDRVLQCYSGYQGDALASYISKVKSKYRDYVIYHSLKA